MVSACEEFGLEASRLQHQEAVQVEQLYLELRDTLKRLLQRATRY